MIGDAALSAGTAKEKLRTKIREVNIKLCCEMMTTVSSIRIEHCLV